MTKISEAAKRKRMELLMEQSPGAPFNPPNVLAVLDRVLQEYSDVAKDVADYLKPGGFFEPALDRMHRESLQSLILPDEPDALAVLRAVLKEMTGEMPPPGMDWGSALIDRVSKGLAKRGKALKIVEADDE